MQLSEYPQHPDNFYDMLDKFAAIKGNPTSSYGMDVSRIHELAEGKNPEGMRDMFGEDWTPADFEDLLLELGEDTTPPQSIH